MKPYLRKAAVSAVILSIFGSVWGAQPAAQPNPLVQGNTEFAFGLYDQLKNSPGNLFFSPYSISTALAMTYAGARGETERQMSLVLRFNTPQAQVHSSFGQLQRQLGEAGQQKGIEVNLANALWGQQGHAFLPSFVEVARREYQANVNQADFVKGAELARGRINEWVSQQTKEKIRDLLPPGSIGDLTRLVLANAVYFKGNWAKPFEKGATSNQPFHLSPQKQENVPLMHHTDDVRYFENNDFQAVELPYEGGDLSMVVMLPRRNDGCGDLEKRLNPALLSSCLSQMKKRKVEIFLPRYKVESKFRLNDTLAAMGMREPFEASADFSGMDGRKQLYISAVFHKAWGEINEEGTEAAAATGVIVNLTSIARPAAAPPVFRADHPFIFLIRSVRSGSILFLGRLVDPSA